MKLNFFNKVVAIIAAIGTASGFSHAAEVQQDQLKSVVDREIFPIKEKYDIPGMAVGIVVKGKSYVFNYGVASLTTRKPVTRDTLFELGSISKTFTATLASYAQANGYLSLSDKVSTHLPFLQNTQFGNVSLLNLGTHTPGGLPLQVPDEIHNKAQLMRYFKTWQPTYPAGTHRTYANPGIGMLGLITAKSMGQPFEALIEQTLFPALGMQSSYINVPALKMADYAQGYTKKNKPIRVTAEILSSEAYGIKATASDMLRFLQANLGLIKLEQKLQRAVTDTHIGYFKVGAMTQSLIWEQYPYPSTLKTLLAGNSSAMIFNAMPATQITPLQKPQTDVWINKTGSTDGFGAYIAFIPKEQLGIVILANKNYPMEDRVTIAHRILTQLINELDRRH